MPLHWRVKGGLVPCLSSESVSGSIWSGSSPTAWGYKTGLPPNRDLGSHDLSYSSCPPQSSPRAPHTEEWECPQRRGSECNWKPAFQSFSLTWFGTKMGRNHSYSLRLYNFVIANKSRDNTKTKSVCSTASPFLAQDKCLKRGWVILNGWIRSSRHINTL